MPFSSGEGWLAECVNLIPGKGGLVNIQPPKDLEITLLSTETIVYVHISGTYTHYIAYDKDNATLAYYDRDGVRKTIFSPLRSYTDINSVGNTLIVLTEEKRMFFLFESGNYKNLGDLPELPEIEFSMYSSTDKKEYTLNAACRWYKEIPVDVGNENEEILEAMRNAVYATTNVLRETAYKEGLFIYPFKLCYVLTYYDGSIARGSAPILLMPSTHTTFSNTILNKKLLSKDYVLHMVVQACRLYHTTTLPESLPDWKEVIKSIDYYITAPEQTLEETADIQSFKQVQSETYTNTYPTGVYSDNLEFKDSVHTIPPVGNLNPLPVFSNKYINLPYHPPQDIESALMEDGTFYFLGSEKIDEIYNRNHKEIWIIPSIRAYSQEMSESDSNFLCPVNTVMTGRYHSGDENGTTQYEYATLKAVDINGKLTSGTITVEDIIWDSGITESGGNYHAPANRVIVGRNHNDDENGTTQYATAVIKFNGEETFLTDSRVDAVKESGGEWFKTDTLRVIVGRNHNGDENGWTEYTHARVKVPIWSTVPGAKETLSTIENQKKLPLEYFSNTDIVPQNVFTYNGRANYYNIGRTLFKGYRYFFNWVCPSDAYSYSYKIYVRLKTDTNEERVVMREFSTSSQIGTYFYYPDPGAYEAVIEKYRNGAKIGDLTLQLTEHPALNGAYFFAGFPTENTPVKYNTNTKPLEIEVNETLTRYTNKIYTSEVDNPFSVTVENVNTIGSGAILAVSTATKALSQGQFGQFPLYVFCSDGIYTMQVSDAGGISSVHPVSRDVCNNPAAVTQLDNSLVFTTGKGLMLLQGSDVTLLSEKMNGNNLDETMYNVEEGFEDLFVKDTAPFTAMLKTCTMSFDYSHALLHIFPADGDGKHHVLSLATGEFSSYTGYDIKAAVPAYPQNVIQIGNRLHTFDRLDDPTTVRRGMLITRPMSFGNPMALKVLADVRMLYNRTSEGTKCRIAAWVSNDLLHWFRLRSLRAGSFKWYRFAIFTRLTDDDALVGLTALTEERRSHKLK